MEKTSTWAKIDLCRKKTSVPSISEKIDEEDNNKNSVKKGSSSSKKRKSSKNKKISKGEDETARSEINLLAASADPDGKEDGNEDLNNTAEEVPISNQNELQEEPVKEKVRKKSSKKKKTSRKGSDSSMKDPLADSHSSLKDYFPDQSLKNFLQGLHVSFERARKQSPINI